MRALFLFGVTGVLGCQATWEWTDTGVTQGDVDPPNVCQDLLEDLGYPMTIQEELADPKTFTILFQDEPEERMCGGMVAELDEGEAWVQGVINSGNWVDLLVPARPPDQFRVVSWGLEDDPDNATDAPDEERIYWSGTSTTAYSAKFVNEGQAWSWARQDLPNEEGVATAYLILGE